MLLLLVFIKIQYFFCFCDFLFAQVTAGEKPLNLRSWDNCFINWASVACQILSIFFLLFFSFCSASDRWSQTLKLKITDKLSYQLRFCCLLYSINIFFFFSLSVSFLYFFLVQVTAGVNPSNLRPWANCSIDCFSSACHIQHSILFSLSVILF